MSSVDPTRSVNSSVTMRASLTDQSQPAKTPLSRSYDPQPGHYTAGVLLERFVCGRARSNAYVYAPADGRP